MAAAKSEILLDIESKAIKKFIALGRNLGFWWPLAFDIIAFTKHMSNESILMHGFMKGSTFLTRKVEPVDADPWLSVQGVRLLRYKRVIR